MKSILYYFTLIVLLSQNLFSQKIANIDFDLIKSKITDKTSSFYYTTLIERFNKSDSTLIAEEYTYLYYGNVFSGKYQPYFSSDNEDKFIEKYNAEKFKKALSYGEKVLRENPINLKILFKTAVCYSALKDTKMAKQFAKKYYSLLDAIYSSGNGNSLENPYVVVKVEDEYQILEDLELNSKGQALIGDVDKLTIDTTNQKRAGKITEPELYFNVRMPLESLKKEFSEKR